MTFLIDTCILSETVKKQPDHRVATWFSANAHCEMYISAITIGELNKGIARLPVSRRKTQLESWLRNDVEQYFGRHILPFSASTARIWGDLCARAEQNGHPCPEFDAMIAATAIEHDLTLVTRNVRDFPFPELRLINPFAH